MKAGKPLPRWLSSASTGPLESGGRREGGGMEREKGGTVGGLIQRGVWSQTLTNQPDSNPKIPKPHNPDPGHLDGYLLFRGVQTTPGDTIREGWHKQRSKWQATCHASLTVALEQ